MASCFKKLSWEVGARAAQSVKHLTSAWVMTSGSWDGAPRGASTLWGVCPFPCLCCLSLRSKQANLALKERRKRKVSEWNLRFGDQDCAAWGRAEGEEARQVRVLARGMVVVKSYKGRVQPMGLETSMSGGRTQMEGAFEALVLLLFCLALPLALLQWR